MRLIFMTAPLMALGTLATAQGYDARYDMQLWSAVDQMAQSFGMACQMGDPNACGGMQYVQDLAGYLIYTNDWCVQGNQQACLDFQGAYTRLDQDYGQFIAYYQAPAQMPDAGGVNPLGATHEDRMANIAAWGAQMQANGQANSDLLDQRHADFMANF